MRIILLTILALAGCSSSSGGGSCTEEEGKAPCCNPPAVEDLVCDEGAELKHEVNNSSEDYMCRIEGQQGIFGDGLVMVGDGRVNYVFNGEIWACSLEGRALRVTSQDTGCRIGCWEEDGQPCADDRVEPCAD